MVAGDSAFQLYDHSQLERSLVQCIMKMCTMDHIVRNLKVVDEFCSECSAADLPAVFPPAKRDNARLDDAFSKAL